MGLTAFEEGDVSGQFDSPSKPAQASLTDMMGGTAVKMMAQKYQDDAIRSEKEGHTQTWYMRILAYIPIVNLLLSDSSAPILSMLGQAIYQIGFAVGCFILPSPIPYYGTYALGILYPVHCSSWCVQQWLYCAKQRRLRNKSNVPTACLHTTNRWLRYWIVFFITELVHNKLSVVGSYLPLWWRCKAIIVLALQLPYPLHGANYLIAKLNAQIRNVGELWTEVSVNTTTAPAPLGTHQPKPARPPAQDLQSEGFLGTKPLIPHQDPRLQVPTSAKNPMAKKED